MKGAILGIACAIPIAYVGGRNQCLYLSDYPANLACAEFATAIVMRLNVLVVGGIVGMVVGHLYGKIKNRKRLNPGFPPARE